MIQNFYNYEPNLPKTVQSKDKFNQAYSEALNAVSEAKEHWRALLATPEIADRCKDIDVALDDKAAIIAYYTEKIAAVEALPVPPSEKAKMLQEWQSAKDDAEAHLNALEDAMDSLPCGYITYEDDNPDSVSISWLHLPSFLRASTPSTSHVIDTQINRVVIEWEVPST